MCIYANIFVVQSWEDTRKKYKEIQKRKENGIASL